MDVKQSEKIIYDKRNWTYYISGFSMSTISSFKGIENKPNVYRAKDCIKHFMNFYESMQ